MSARHGLRRPRTKALAALYDEGAAAAVRESPNPYKPAQRAGDSTRAWLWEQGYADEREMIEIEALL